MDLKLLQEIEMIAKGKFLANIIIIFLFAALVIAVIIYVNESRETSVQVYSTNAAGHLTVKMKSSEEKSLGLTYNQILSSFDGRFDMKIDQSVNDRTLYNGIYDRVSLTIATKPYNMDDVLYVNVFLFGIDNATGAFDSQSLELIAGLLKNIFPGWKDAGRYIAAQIKILRQKPDSGKSIIRDDKRIDLKYQTRMNIVSDGLIIVIEPL
jgi:hypothetical protein